MNAVVMPSEQSLERGAVAIACAGDEIAIRIRRRLRALGIVKGDWAEHGSHERAAFARRLNSLFQAATIPLPGGGNAAPPLQHETPDAPQSLADARYFLAGRRCCAAQVPRSDALPQLQTCFNHNICVYAATRLGNAHTAVARGRLRRDSAIEENEINCVTRLRGVSELEREAGAGEIPQTGGCERGLAAPGCSWPAHRTPLQRVGG
jgi:hypothetical protein